MNDSALLQKARQIKLLILDVDGVLTDGRIYLNEKGEESRAFHVHDGLGIKRLMKAGIQVAIISSRNSPLVKYRMQELGVQLVYQGQKDKLATYEQMLSELGLTDEVVAYMGDDLPDLPVMARVGLPIAVANAVAAVKKQAFWHSTHSGGEGAVREVCDIILSHE